MKRRALVVVAAVVAGSGAVAAAWPGEDLARDLDALATRRRAELLALAPAEQPGHLRAFGRCARPDAARIAALEARLARWVVDEVPGWRLVDGAELAVSVGCEDRRGLVVDVQADLERGDRRLGYWWVLRVRPKAIEVVAYERGTATLDFMEWADERSVETLAIVDLDGDGASELLIARDAHEGGARPDLRIARDTARGLVPIGHHADSIAVAAMQPPASAHTLVLALGEESGGRRLYRCVDAAGPWHPCAAAAAAEQYDDALDAAGWLAGRGQSGPPDADLVERRLRAMGVPAGERAAFVARAAPAALKDIVERAAADRGRARLTLTADEAAIEAAAAEHALATALRAATGDARCAPAGARRARKAAAAIRGWMRGHELERLRALAVCPPTGRCDAAVAVTPAIEGSCVAARGAYWLARWQHDARTGAIERRALFFARGGAPVLVTDSVVPFDPRGEAGLDEDGAIEAKFSRVGGAVTALVRTPGDRMLAVVDDTVRGAPVIGGRLVWPWGGAHGDVWMRADSLLEVHGKDDVAFLHATPAGLVPVMRLALPPMLAAPPVTTDAIGALLEPLQRGAWAHILAGYLDEARLGEPGYRAEVLAALRLDGADPSLIDRVARAAAASPAPPPP